MAKHTTTQATATQAAALAHKASQATRKAARRLGGTWAAQVLAHQATAAHQAAKAAALAHSQATTPTAKGKATRQARKAARKAQAMAAQAQAL